MPKRRPDNEDGVSLFPFLSILACVIGTLTLMISALALGQMDTEKVSSLEQYENLRSQVSDREQEIERLRARIAALREQTRSEEQAGQQQLAQARERLQQLAGQLEQAQQAAQQKVDIDIPAVDTAAHKQRIAKLQEQLASLLEQIAQLEKQIAERKLPPVESQVTVLPAGSGLDLEPVFVECAAGAVVLHTGPQPQRVLTGELAANKELLALLSGVAKSKQQTIVFLVRSNGLSTYNAARGLATKAGARHGKLPVVGKGRIDLTHFTVNK